LLTGGSDISVDSVILQNNKIGAYFTGSETSSVEENIMRDNDIGVAGHSANKLDIMRNIWKLIHWLESLLLIHMNQQ
jgi:parallel beta-helix repeat protein